MMMDQMQELPPLLSGEVPMMHHMINGDASQQVRLRTRDLFSASSPWWWTPANETFPSQVILVQVNPGETFTIRREDGTLQCIQGLFSIRTSVFLLKSLGTSKMIHRLSQGCQIDQFLN